jgi:hypothetical protein
VEELLERQHRACHPRLHVAADRLRALSSVSEP